VIVVVVVVKVQGYLHSYPTKGFAESVLTQQLTSKQKNQNNHLVDDFECVLKCNDDPVDKSSAQPNT
jgi:hypothetical protein